MSPGPVCVNRRGQRLPSHNGRTFPTINGKSMNPQTDDERIRAHFAMLALRDMANYAVRHALEIAPQDPEAANYFNSLAMVLRDKERAAARAAGVDKE